jgi:hypothetical protein
MTKNIVIPSEKQETINFEYHKQKNKSEVFFSIQRGLLELKSSRKKGTILPTLSDFLKNNK